LGRPNFVLDGKTGFLVDNVEACAARCLELLNQAARARQMGEAGREHVRGNFLVDRLLVDYLSLFHKLA
jgi:trehalose synthase